MPTSNFLDRDDHDLAAAPGEATDARLRDLRARWNPDRVLGSSLDDEPDAR